MTATAPQPNTERNDTQQQGMGSMQLDTSTVTSINVLTSPEQLTSRVRANGGQISKQKVIDDILKSMRVDSDTDPQFKVLIENLVSQKITESGLVGDDGNLIAPQKAQNSSIPFTRNTSTTQQTPQVGGISNPAIHIPTLAAASGLSADTLSQIIGASQFASLADFIQKVLPILYTNRLNQSLITPQISAIVNTKSALSQAAQMRALQFMMPAIANQYLNSGIQTTQSISQATPGLQSFASNLLSQSEVSDNTRSFVTRAVDGVSKQAQNSVLNPSEQNNNDDDSGSLSPVPFNQVGDSDFTSDGKKDLTQKENKETKNPSQQNKPDQNNQRSTQKTPSRGGINPQNQQNTTTPSSQTVKQSEQTQDLQDQTPQSQTRNSQSSRVDQNSINKNSQTPPPSGAPAAQNSNQSNIDQIRNAAKEFLLNATPVGRIIKNWRIILFAATLGVSLFFFVGPAVGFPAITRVLYCEEPFKSDIAVIAGRTAFDLATGKVVPEKIWKDCQQECSENGNLYANTEATPCQKRRIKNGEVDIADVGAIIDLKQGTENNQKLYYFMLATKAQEINGFPFDYGFRTGEYSDADSCGPYQQRINEFGYKGNQALIAVVKKYIGDAKYNELFGTNSSGMNTIYARLDEYQRNSSLPSSYLHEPAFPLCQELIQTLVSQNKLGMWDEMFLERIKNKGLLDKVLNADRNTNYIELVYEVQIGQRKPYLNTFVQYLYDANIYAQSLASCGGGNTNGTSVTHYQNDIINTIALLAQSPREFVYNAFTPLTAHAQDTIDYRNWLDIAGGAFDSTNYVAGGGRLTTFNETNGGNNSGGIDLTFGNKKIGIDDTSKAKGFPHYTAIGEGVVVFTVTGVSSGLASSFGNRVSIYHPFYNPDGKAPFGVIIDYSHLDQVLVQPGEVVGPGVVFGTQGNTGSVRPSTGFYQTDIAIVKADKNFYDAYNNNQYDQLRTNGRLPEIERSITVPEALNVYNDYINRYIQFYNQNEAGITKAMQDGTFDTIASPGGAPGSDSPLSSKNCSAICDVTNVQSTKVSNANTQNTRKSPTLAQLFGIIDAFAAEKPTRYSDISQQHRDFLKELALSKGYIEYKDAGLSFGDGTNLNPQAQAAFEEFAGYVREKTGKTIQILSGYRSYDIQVLTFFSRISTIFDPNSTDNNATARSEYLERMINSAAPGFSEHSTGLAFDYYSLQDPETQNLDRNNWPDDLEAIVNGDGEHAGKLKELGLRLSYPRISRSGAEYEPWHLLYVGKNNENPIQEFLVRGQSPLTGQQQCDRINFSSAPGDAFVTTGVYTSAFGDRVNPVTGERKLHGGIDMAPPLGTPIVAYADGVVDVSVPNNDSSGWGNYVVIIHPQLEIETIYAHMQFSPKVAKGQQVKAGDLIGFVGSTGRSTGPHLHFETRKLNPSGLSIPVNPCNGFLNCPSVGGSFELPSSWSQEQKDAYNNFKP